MLFIANTIATIISCCSHIDELQPQQQQHQPQLLISVVCVVIVSICIVISLKRCSNSTEESRKHQQQEESLYQLTEKEYPATTSNHVLLVRLRSNITFLNPYHYESQLQSEFAKSFTHVVDPLFTSNVLERLDQVGVLLWTISTNHRYLIHLVGKTVISISIFYTTLFLDVPKYDYYFYLIFILPLILRYLLFNGLTNFMINSNKQTVPCRIISFVSSRIYGSKLKFLL